MKKIGRFTFDLLDELEEARSVYERATRFRKEIDDWLSGGLKGEMEKIKTEIEVILKSTIAKELLQGIDVFEQFAPPIHGDPRTNRASKWWLADLAHQRETLTFARRLWELSEGNNDLRAYALGYLTHVGGDASGHPTVNFLVGGPY